MIEIVDGGMQTHRSLKVTVRVFVGCECLSIATYAPLAFEFITTRWDFIRYAHATSHVLHRYVSAMRSGTGIDDSQCVHVFESPFRLKKCASTDFYMGASLAPCISVRSEEVELRAQ